MERYMLCVKICILILGKTQTKDNFNIILPNMQ